MADGTRMADKLKNAFGIDLSIQAQTAINDYAPNALSLVPVELGGGPAAAPTTYQAARDTNPAVKWWIIGAIIFFILFLVRR